jgi:hypothetical protein
MMRAPSSLSAFTFLVVHFAHRLIAFNSSLSSLVRCLLAMSSCILGFNISLRLFLMKLLACRFASGQLLFRLLSGSVTFG